MKYQKVLYRLVVLLTAAALALAGWGKVFPADAGAGAAGSGPADLDQDLPPDLEAMVQTFMADLGTRFNVGRGYMELYTQEDCTDYSYKVMKTCFGNNPAAPYLMPVVPRWPDEFEDLAVKNAFGLDPEGYTPNYRLDPREAILVFGYLPPEAKYFGLQSYLGNRTGEWDDKSSTYQWIDANAPSLLGTFFAFVPNNHARIQVAASLSNAINNVVIQKQSGSTWGQLRFFLITPDDYMNGAIRSYLVTKTAAANIFTEPIPGAGSLKFGLGPDAEDFLTLIRYSMPLDGGQEGSASYAWRHTPPLAVLRIRDVDPDRTETQEYPAFTEPETRTAVDETGLAGSLDKLAYAISATWNQPCEKLDCADKTEAKTYFPFADWQSAPFNLVGPKCMAIGMNCLGDTQDTVYQVSKALWIDDGSIYAVLGPVGTETGNATYTALGLNSNYYKKGFDNIEGADLVGTAKAYSTTVGLDWDNLFVYYVARSCAGLEALTNHHCREIPESAFQGCPDPSADTCELLTLSLRDYIRPGTQRGPASALTLPPRVLRLRPPNSMGATRHTIYLPVIGK